MIGRCRFLYIMSFSTFLIVINQISYAQFSNNNSNYVVSISGDTIRNCEIKKPRRFTNKDKITIIYNDTTYTLPSKSIKSYYSNQTYYISEYINNENKHVLVNYTIGGFIKFGQALSRTGEAVFYLKRSDTEEIVCLENHKYSLLSLFKNYIPEFDVFYKTYNAKVYYDYESIAELISAYNAFKEPTIFIPVKYKYKEKNRLGIFASLGFGSLKINNISSDFINRNNFSIGLNFKQFYTRNIFFSSSLSYNNSSFIGTNEDVIFKAVSLEPNLCFGTNLNSKFFISLKGGLYLSYNVDSYFSKKTFNGLVLDLTPFNFGPKVGVDLIFLNRYSFFINYYSCKIKTSEGRKFLNSDIIKGGTDNFQFGLLFFFY